MKNMCVYTYCYRLYELQHYTKRKTAREREAGQNLTGLSDTLK